VLTVALWKLLCGWSDVRVWPILLKKDFGRGLRAILIQSPNGKYWFKKAAYAIRLSRFGGMLGTFSTASIKTGIRRGSGMTPVQEQIRSDQIR
jgi:hypothetical protein